MTLTMPGVLASLGKAWPLPPPPPPPPASLKCKHTVSLEDLKWTSSSSHPLCTHYMPGTGQHLGLANSIHQHPEGEY